MWSSALDEKLTCDWKLHWGLDRAPFAEHGRYISLPGHDEAALRLVHCAQAAGRSAFLTGDAGLGKSTVLRKVLAQVRGPRVRCVSLRCPRESTLLLAALAERLGHRVGREPSPLECWRAIERSFRLASIQGTQVVIGIDDGENASGQVLREIESLASVGAGLNMRLTIIRAGRPAQGRQVDPASRWSPAIGLESLTRSEAERYLIGKLADAGCNAPVFTPRAVTRLHCLTTGVPRGIDHLATACLIVAAARGLEAIPPDLVDTLEANAEPELR